MAVLVTGGAGYIGGHMTLGLLDASEKVVVLDNLSTGFARAAPEAAKIVVGDFGDAELVSRLVAEHEIDAIAHFVAKIVVPESVADPLGYYLNNTAKALSLIQCAVKGGVRNFIFSSTAAVYGETSAEPVREDATLNPILPYGRSKLMVEWMLQDADRAHDLSYVVLLRYFNVAGADPQGRLGQSTPNATHLIKRGVQTALGRYPSMDVVGEDYPTRDGTYARDYIQVTDLIDAHLAALAYLRGGGDSVTCNCGYGRGATVKEVIDVVKRSNEGRDYLSVKLDDPSFNAPIYANLFDDEDGDGYTLIRSRSRKASGERAGPAKTAPLGLPGGAFNSATWGHRPAPTLLSAAAP